MIGASLEDDCETLADRTSQKSSWALRAARGGAHHRGTRRTPRGTMVWRLSPRLRRGYAPLKVRFFGKFHNQRKVDNSFLGQTSVFRHRPLCRILIPDLDSTGRLTGSDRF